MATETVDLRNKARRLKNLAITKAIHVLENPEDYTKEIYEQTYLTVLKNAVPRAQEVTGEEGEAIKVVFDKTFNDNGTSDFTSQTAGDSSLEEQV